MNLFASCFLPYFYFKSKRFPRFLNYIFASQLLSLSSVPFNTLRKGLWLHLNRTSLSFANFLQMYCSIGKKRLNILPDDLVVSLKTKFSTSKLFFWRMKVHLFVEKSRPKPVQNQLLDWMTKTIFRSTNWWFLVRYLSFHFWFILNF